MGLMVWQMTKKEALQAMLDGKKVRVNTWYPDRWVQWSNSRGEFLDQGDVVQTLDYLYDNLTFELYTEPMKIEVGKWYRTAGGERQFIVGLLPAGLRYVVYNEFRNYSTVTLAGKYTDTCPTCNDLTEECEAPK